MPGSSYNYRLAQIVESVASTSRQSETVAPETAGQQQTVDSLQEQQPLQEIDPNKIIDASELDRYVNHVVRQIVCYCFIQTALNRLFPEERYFSNLSTGPYRVSKQRFSITCCYIVSLATFHCYSSVDR